MELQQSTSLEESQKNKIKPISPFEKILHQIGAEGRFQKLLVWGFMVPVAILSSFGINNTTLLLTTPDHTCHVPGRPHNVTVEEWKNMTVPWELNSLEETRRSLCSMFNISNGWTGNISGEDGGEVVNTWRKPLNTYNNRSVVDCQHGWDFDDSEWRETPVSLFEWVCKDEHIVTTLFSLTFAGNAIGTLFFSIISDRYGRKPIFYVTLSLSILCSIPSIFAPNLIIYSGLKFFLATAYLSFVQLPYIIATEICGEHLRTVMVVATFTTSVIGACMVPLFAYIFAYWKTFIVVCHLPALVFIVCCRVLPESPRWLLYCNKLSECERILRRIAEINGKTFTEETKMLLKEAQKQETKKGSFKDILVSKVLTKHLALNSLLMSIGACLLNAMMLNIHNMGRNKLVNFFIFALVGLPGYITGGLSARQFGRRYSALVISGLCAIFCFLATYVLDNELAMTGVCATIKMLGGALFLVMYMQVGELFPTSLRSTAYGIVGVVQCMLTIIIPFVIALGNSNAFLPYYILSGICLLAVVLSSFLPETVGHPLPQTMKEATLIGRNQPFFSFIHKWNAYKYIQTEDINNVATEEEKMV